MATSTSSIVDCQRRINYLLESCLPNSEHKLHQAIRYSVLNGGKRLRPLLVYAAGEVVNAPIEKLDNTAIALECIHAYSLIHDDLPSMDNDDYRRGQPSCHKKFDEATAILAGDALQSFAFEILARNNDIKQIILLAKSIGEQGMVLGQSEDINLKNQQINQTKLYEIYQLKTGKLITVSVQLGLLCAEEYSKNNSAIFKILTDFSENFGLAFQLRDDLSDQDYSGENNNNLQKQIKFYFNQARQNLDQILKLKYKINLFEKIIEGLLNEKN